MNKVFIFFFLIFITIQARENPFFPSPSEEDIPISSNQIKSFEPLKRASINLPDSARVLQEVAFKYQNLDGSIDTKIMKLDQSIDWHTPLFVSQNIKDEKISISDQKIEIEEDKKSITESKSEKKSTISFDQKGLIADFTFIKFFLIDKSNIKIAVPDKMIRNFTMANPHRIVIDFKKEAGFLTMKKDLNVEIFKSIILGNHDNYYRVVITLDGQYKTKIVQNEDGIIATCF